jgi:hypothetical protein
VTPALISSPGSAMEFDPLRWLRGEKIARVKAHSNQENFPQKEHFVKCDWPTQIFNF